jgi:single stranded DNA-binding protein
MDINEVTILGAIKGITDILTLKNGQQCCWLNILTDVSFQKKDGTTGHNQASHRVIAYGKYAQVIKGKVSIDQKIFLQGRLKTNSWVYRGVSFQKTFIVLERFKLQVLSRNESKETEDDEQEQEMEEVSDNEDMFTGDWYEDNDNSSEDYFDMDSFECENETGWPYED